MKHLTKQLVNTLTLTPYADADLLSCLTAPQDPILDDFAEVWCDPAKMEMAISRFLFARTQNILSGNYDDARDHALMVRYFEQHVAVVLEQTQAQTNFPKLHEMNFPKLHEACHADVHILVKFLRKRITCTCLDVKKKLRISQRWTFAPTYFAIFLIERRNAATQCIVVDADV